MVRQEIVNRDKGIEKIYIDQNQVMVDCAKERLNK